MEGIPTKGVTSDENYELVNLYSQLYAVHQFWSLDLCAKQLLRSIEYFWDDLCAKQLWSIEYFWDAFIVHFGKSSDTDSTESYTLFSPISPDEEEVPLSCLQS